jgi:hypothetical protein
VFAASKVSLAVVGGIACGGCVREGLVREGLVRWFVKLLLVMAEVSLRQLVLLISDVLVLMKVLVLMAVVMLLNRSLY